MKNKIIFELKINSKDCLIAYEKSNYDTCYEDSILYFHTGSKRKKLIENSFCYGFAAEMYYRMYNIHNFYSLEDYVKLLKDFLDNQTYEPEQVDYNNLLNNSYFFGCSVLADFDLYLVKINQKYTLLFIKTMEIKLTGKYEVNVVNKFIISEETFTEWKFLISAEWEKRVRIEGLKINKKEQSEEEWQEYFQFMRTDKKQN